MLSVLVSALVSLVVNCLIVPAITYFLNRRSRRVANSGVRYSRCNFNIEG